jgi:undecaprenyl pyrophosphate synthase
MRRTAYLKAVEEARKLPNEVSELKRYFCIPHSPRQEALTLIKKLAREDTERLFDCEMIDVINAANAP